MRYEKYSLEPELAAPWLFTLLQDVTRENKKTKETYEDREAIAYGLTFEKALRKIASLAADKTTIEGYIKDYDRISQEVEKRLKGA